jgi:uncharacterized membrane protein YhiD involved in acid resistance
MNVLSHQDVLTRLLLAAFLGSVIGFERERLLWAAASAPTWWFVSAPA